MTSNDMRKIIESVKQINELDYERIRHPFPTGDSRSVRTVDEDLITIDITVGTGEDLKSKTPSLGLFKNGELVFEFTWDEARELMAAIEHVTDVAEYG